MHHIILTKRKYNKINSTLILIKINNIFTSLSITNYHWGTLLKAFAIRNMLGKDKYDILLPEIDHASTLSFHKNY